MAQANIPKRQLRAIAYQLADEIETRANALIAKDASLTRVDAIKRAIDAMAKA